MQAAQEKRKRSERIRKKSRRIRERKKREKEKGVKETEIEENAAGSAVDISVDSNRGEGMSKKNEYAGTNEIDYDITRSRVKRVVTFSILPAAYHVRIRIH
jgi:ribosomal protein L21E